MALNLDKKKIRRKIALFAVICGLLGAIGIFEPLSLALSVLQSKAMVKPVSGDIVVVGIDSPSIEKIGRWPWPRDKQAELIKSIDSYGPKAIYIDIGYQGTTSPSADRALREALTTTKAKTKIVALANLENDRVLRLLYSHRAAVGSTKSVSVYAPYLLGHILEIPTSVSTKRGLIPSMAADIAGWKGTATENFKLDYGYNVSSIPAFSAKDIFEHTVNPGELKGKTVILGATDKTQNDVHLMPGNGKQPGVYFQVLGAETLKNGIPLEWGWMPFFLFALLICAAQLTRFGLRYSKPICWAGLITILGASSGMAIWHVGNDPFPAMTLIGITGIFIARQKTALRRSQRNEETGFSDMTGYMVEEVVSNALFIAATIHRPEARRGYILDSDDLNIIRAVGQRLSSVLDERQLTHNNNMQFVWEMPSIATSTLAAHMEGLRQLFVEPLNIDGRKIDVDIFFGVDRDVNSNVKLRAERALSASAEARDNQTTFKITTTSAYGAHLESKFAEEFAAAVPNGDIQILFRAHHNLGNNLIRSAEATIGWVHPAYGQISPARLFGLARQTGNLYNVSLFLCQQAAHFSARLAKISPGFTVAAKISVDILLDPNFKPAMLSIAAAEQCRPSDIIFDIVDIHAFVADDAARLAIHNLQVAGFRVGIGNFGITSSDIDLLRLFEPDEIFLAASFSAELLGSTSNQIFAEGALRIAQASDIISTADDVEDRAVLAQLRRRGCDRCKGKALSMPMNFLDFVDMHFEENNKMLG